MFNQVMLVGRLTKDPELRYTSAGAAVTHITIAVNRSFKNASGEIEADYVNCTLWRKTAENTALYCQKGSLVGISGRIQTRSYENVKGVKVYVTEVMADTVRFMDSKAREKAAD
ncbi:single-stranded DNA-binding protein SsbB [Bacillus atrophaeus]|uniref:single-stranded DNA-binding protein SsbB n=1 Tax=Bacillus atrophaeus TaxID=1452 RepID=UPI0018F53F5F|nr:single-stranded DNA-binding protein SsbB [Bacillus atrophaeus]MBJ7894877.1 single-stranded DNA-binding protein [Bacillus atrophaeus]